MQSSVMSVFRLPLNLLVVVGTKLTDKVTLDASGFYNVYDNLIYYAGGTPFVGTILGSADGSVNAIGSQQYNITPTYTYNGDKGHTYGFELAGHYNPSKTVRATLGYSYLSYDGFSLGTTLILLLEGRHGGGMW